MPKACAISGTTRLFGIVGDPIAQVRAPDSFNAHCRERGIDAVMLPLHVRPDGVTAAFAGFKALANLDGLVITVPHKFAFAELMDDLGPHAARTRAVNAARRNADGRWTGELFDGIGFVEGLRTAGIDPTGKSFLVYGAGGAGTAISSALLDVDPARITVTDTVAEKARSLCRTLRAAASNPPLEAADDPDPAGFDIVVNATPLGMKEDDPLPFDPARMAPGAIAAEAVMKPPITPVLREAERRGLRIHPGIHMLDGQMMLFMKFFGLPT